ncbi:MAG: hypothetical protein LCH80_13180 [Proteobacteria bacterium]|nr:hypothetical protein [Pseudomonadota bacterium]
MAGTLAGQPYQILNPALQGAMIEGTGFGIGGSRSDRTCALPPPVPRLSSRGATLVGIGGRPTSPERGTSGTPGTAVPCA